MNRFWKWTRNEAEGQPTERTLSFDGVIASESWYDDDITPEAFREELMRDTGPITIAVNSPGGDCIAASMIYTMLQEYPGRITVRVEGVAASAASVVAMAGDVIQMSPTSLLMIHNPSTIAAGESADLAKAIRLMEETKESIINAYTIKTGLSRVRLSHMMDDETWLNAVKAKELGFCDEILYTETEQQGAEEKPSFIFSQREANLVLVNLVKERHHGEEAQGDPKDEASETADGISAHASEVAQTKASVPDDTAAQTEVSADSADVTIPEKSRIKAADLMKRLSLLK